LNSNSYQQLSFNLAETIKQELLAKPNCNLGLPTGRTPLLGYKILCQWSSTNNFDWQFVKCFALDEYVDVPEDKTFQYYLNQNLYVHTNIQKKHCFSPIQECDYDQLIAEQGGLDLTILGMGRNGHIAFNEPGTVLHTWTHSIWLTESTRLANAEFFKKSDDIPKKAVTIGIQTILNSRKIVLVVSGENKKEVLQKALSGPVTSEIPASFLQTHQNLHVLADFAY
jgi:glucosamine-6-phosphate deaminase